MNALANLDRARIMLAESRTLPEIKKIRDIAEGAKAYARAEKMGIEIQNYAGEIVAEASRKMGEFLLATTKRAGSRGIGKKVESREGIPLLPVLADLGISKNQSSNCQTIARLPRAEFDKHIAAVKSDGQVITTSALVAAAKQYKRRIEYEGAAHNPIILANPMILLIRASAFNMPIVGKSVQVIVTSPPYFGLREYRGEQGKEPFGQEATAELYVKNSIIVLKECLRVLRDNGVVFWNIADSYSGPKGGLHLIPERVAIAAQDNGWCVRSIIIWVKSNPMPEPVKNRPTRSYEKILMLTKSGKYFWDSIGASEPSTGKTAPFPLLGKTHGRSLIRNDIKYDRSISKCPSDYVSENRNMRNVWTFAVPHLKNQHFASFPEELPARCIKAASAPGDIVLDPFHGSGTTGVAAQRLGRRFVGLDLAYEDIAKKRIAEYEKVA